MLDKTVLFTHNFPGQTDLTAKTQRTQMINAFATSASLR